MYRALLLAGTALLAFGGWVLAQGFSPPTGTITQQQITGNECWSVGQGPGGIGNTLCSWLIQTTTQPYLTTLAAPITLTPQQSLVIVTAQPMAGSNVTAPASPPNGMSVTIANGTNANFATAVWSFLVNTGQTFVNGPLVLTVLASGASHQVVYISSNNSWYQVR